MAAQQLLATAGQAESVQSRTTQDKEHARAAAILERIMAEDAHLKRQHLGESEQRQRPVEKVILKIPNLRRKTTTKNKRKNSSRMKINGTQLRKKVKINNVQNSLESNSNNSDLPCNFTTSFSSVSNNFSTLNSNFPASSSSALFLPSENTSISIPDLLIFDLFFDLVITPGLESNFHDSNIQPLENSLNAAPNIFSRIRIALFKHSLLQAFLQNLSISQISQPASLFSLFEVFRQSSLAFGLTFS